MKAIKKKVNEWLEIPTERFILLLLFWSLVLSTSIKLLIMGYCFLKNNWGNIIEVIDNIR